MIGLSLSGYVPDNVAPAAFITYAYFYAFIFNNNLLGRYWRTTEYSYSERSVGCEQATITRPRPLISRHDAATMNPINDDGANGGGRREIPATDTTERQGGRYCKKIYNLSPRATVS
jgi:hypothetical protein